MKIMKNRFRKRLAFLLIFTILIMALSPVGCVKRADAADETNTADDVIKLYDKGQLIGKYGDLKTTFENMTDSEGEYKIIFSAEQTEYCIDGEVWLPECESIKFVGNQVDDPHYSLPYISTAVKINDSIHLQSDVTLNNCTLFEQNTTEMCVLDMGSHKLRTDGKYTEIQAGMYAKYGDNLYYESDVCIYCLRIEGQKDSELIINNCNLLIDSDLFIDKVRLEENASLKLKSGWAKIKKVIAKDYSGKVSYYATGRYEIGEISIENCRLNVDLFESAKIRIGKVVLTENADKNKSYFDMYVYCPEITKTYYPRFEIEDIDEDNVNVSFKMEISASVVYDTALEMLVHNDISCLKMPKDYDISKLMSYQVGKYLGTKEFDVVMDDDGNVWLPIVGEIDNNKTTEEELTCELDEEQKDSNGIYYKLNEKDKTATLGVDRDTDSASLLTDLSKIEDGILKIPSYVKCEGETYKVTRIGRNAFKGSSGGFNEVHIPDTVMSIGDKAFWCSVVKLYIGANVADIGEEAIAAGSLKEIFLDDNNTDFVLYQGILFDKDMTTLIKCPITSSYQYYPVYNVPESVKKIAAGAFENSKIFNIKADSVTTVGEHAFYSAKNLRTISLRGVVEIGDEAFGSGGAFNLRGLRNVYLSDKLEKIGKYVFLGSCNIKCLVLPDCSLNISTFGFHSESIEYILGGKNAQYEQQAFENCKNLKLVQLSEAMQYLPSGLFTDCTSLKKVYIPETCLGSENNELFYDIPKNQVTVYGKENLREFAQKNNALFENIEEHEHTFVTQRVQDARVYESGMEVTYCSECHYILDYKEIAAPEQLEDTTYYREPENLVHPSEEPKPSVSPAPQPTKTASVTAKPTQTPMVTKTPTVTVKPTKTPAATATVPSPTQTPIMTDSPPVVSPTAMPNGNVSSKPDKEPEPTLLDTETPNPTDRTMPQPTDNASTSPTNEPFYTISPTPTAATPQHTSVPGLSDKDKKAFIIKINSIGLNKYNQPEIVWKKTSEGIGYEIYRAMSKKIKWQKIAVCEKNSSYRYTDKKAKAGQKYYYRIRLVKKTGGQKYYGKYSNVCMIKTLSIVKPKIKGTTGIYQKIPYVQITLKKYSGTYVEIYIRGRSRKYQKIKLKSSSIKRYKAKFKLKCDNKKAVYYFKVRTIVKKSKKRYYSVYSDCIKVKVTGH